MKKLSMTDSKKHVSIRFVFPLLLLVISASCSDRRINFPKTDLSKENLIPKPLNIVSTNSGFALDEFTTILTPSDSQEFTDIGFFLADKINAQTNLNVRVNEESAKTFISIKQSKNIELKNPESYELKITQDSIVLNSKTAAGAFRGIQTIRQIIPQITNDTLTKNRLQCFLLLARA